jgi:hypothetical protein
MNYIKALALILLTPIMLWASEPSEACVLVKCGIFAGSGTCVKHDSDYTIVLTNKHVIESEQSLSIVHNNREYAAIVLFSDPAEDQAILKVRAKLPIAELTETEPEVGEIVQQWGYDARGNGKLVYKQGRVVQPVRGTFRSTIESYSGDSGCGVFNAEGKLVAVNYGFEGTYQSRGPQLGVRLINLVKLVKNKLLPKHTKDYESFCAEVSKGHTGILSVGGTKGDCNVPVGFLGLTAGEYQCFKGLDGKPKLVPKAKVQECPNGRCPYKS